MVYTNLSDEQIHFIRVLYKTLSCVSIFGCLVIFLLYWFFRDLRKFKFEVVLWLSITNTVYNIASFFPYDRVIERNMTWCCFQSIIMNFSHFASLIWSALIALTALLLVIMPRHLEENEVKYRAVFLAVSYGISLCLSSLLIITETYGNSGAWCWIDSHLENSMARKLILFFYSFLWLMILINWYLIYKGHSIIRSNEQNSVVGQSLPYFRVMKYYPIVLTVGAFPGTINRIISVFYGEEYYALIIVQTIFDSSNGFFIALVFLFTPSLKEALYLCLQMVLKAKGEEDSKEMPDVGYSSGREWSSNSGEERISIEFNYRVSDAFRRGSDVKKVLNREGDTDSLDRSY